MRQRLLELAAERKRFGYQRLHVLLRREGFPVNVKRIYRLYKEEVPDDNYTSPLTTTTTPHGE